MNRGVRRRRLLVAAACGFVAAESRASPAGEPAVSIDAMAFDPPVVRAPHGGRVTWTNRDVVPHTVTAVDGRFDSGPIEPGARWSWTSPRVESIAYRCSYHPTMAGTVIVA